MSRLTALTLIIGNHPQCRREAITLLRSKKSQWRKWTVPGNSVFISCQTCHDPLTLTCRWSCPLRAFRKLEAQRVVRVTYSLHPKQVVLEQTRTIERTLSHLDNELLYVVCASTSWRPKQMEGARALSHRPSELRSRTTPLDLDYYINYFTLRTLCT